LRRIRVGRSSRCLKTISERDIYLSKRKIVVCETDRRASVPKTSRDGGNLRRPRRGELLKLRWSNVDLGLNLVNFTETKTNRDRAVPMEPIVREVLLELNEQSGNAEYVFTNPDTGERGTRMLRNPFPPRVGKLALPTSPFTTCVTRSVLA